MKCVACTIVSKNYIAYAKTWAESMRLSNPGVVLFVLIVDKLCKEDGFLYSPDYNVVGVQELGIDRFDSVSFKYSILELNTNVKPSFLQFLIREKNAEKVIYFDPDIYVYGDISHIFRSLDESSFLLTPHILTPIKDSHRPSEQDHLRAGIFNLGFIAVGSDEQAMSMLGWWSKSCLGLAFNDNRDGLFVDQKWLDLAPALFSRCKILRDFGCNVAYWNLHERELSVNSGGELIVNGGVRLTFFHFSGLVLSNLSMISKHQDRFTLSVREDLQAIFSSYAQSLCKNGHERFRALEYSFGIYDNGKRISDLARRLYAVSEYALDETCNPFEVKSSFCQRYKGLNVLESQSLDLSQNSRTYSRTSLSVTIVNKSFSVLRFFLGPDRYWQFCKYLSYYSIIRNQI